MLARVHATFTPEDLAFTALVLLNKERGMNPARAGRAKLRSLGSREREPLEV